MKKLFKKFDKNIQVNKSKIIALSVVAVLGYSCASTKDRKGGIGGDQSLESSQPNTTLGQVNHILNFIENRVSDISDTNNTNNVQTINNNQINESHNSQNNESEILNLIDNNISHTDIEEDEEKILEVSDTDNTSDDEKSESSNKQNAAHKSFFGINERDMYLYATEKFNKISRKEGAAVTTGFLRAYFLISLAENTVPFQYVNNRLRRVFSEVCVVDIDSNIIKAHKLHLEILKKLNEMPFTPYHKRILYLFFINGLNEEKAEYWVNNVQKYFRDIKDCKNCFLNEVCALLEFIHEYQYSNVNYKDLIKEKVIGNKIPSKKKFEVLDTLNDTIHIEEKGRQLANLIRNSTNTTDRSFIGQLLDMVQSLKTSYSLNYYNALYFLNNVNFVSVMHYASDNGIKLILGDIGNNMTYNKIIESTMVYHEIHNDTSCRCYFSYPPINLIDTSNIISDDPCSRIYLLDKKKNVKNMLNFVCRYPFHPDTIWLHSKFDNTKNTASASSYHTDTVVELVDLLEENVIEKDDNSNNNNNKE